MDKLLFKEAQEDPIEVTIFDNMKGMEQG